VLSFGQGLQHPCAVGAAGGEPGRQSAFAILGQEAASRLISSPPASTRLPMPTSDLTMSEGEVQLVVSQGGGGFGDPIERDPLAVLGDVREGLVSPAAASRDYGVVVSGDAVDGAATDARRRHIRSERLGGRIPAPEAVGVTGRPFSCAFVVVDEDEHQAIVCRRCGARLCDVADSVYDHAIVAEAPVSARAPFNLVYSGSEQFVLRYCFCPHCAHQFDVQIARRGEPLLRAVEPAGRNVTVSPDR
jgi:N-methylhydantoinase B